MQFQLPQFQTSDFIKIKKLKYLSSFQGANHVIDPHMTRSKVKSNPVTGLSGPEGSRKLRFPDFITTVQDGGKVISLTHRPPFPPGNTTVTHFC